MPACQCIESVKKIKTLINGRVQESKKHNLPMCSLFSLPQEDQVVRQDDEPDYIDMLQTVTEEESLLVAAPRRRANTNENMPSGHNNGSLSTDWHLQKMEARLAQVESLLAKILASMKNTNNAFAPRKTQSTNNLEIATSFV